MLAHYRGGRGFEVVRYQERLIQALAGWGIRVSYTAAQRLLRKYGEAAFDRAVRELRRQAREGRPPRRIGGNFIEPGTAPVPEPVKEPIPVSRAPVQMNVLGGNTTYVNDIRSKRVVNSRKRKRNVRKMLMDRQVRESQHHGIFRWQSLTPFADNVMRSYELSVEANEGLNTIFMPVYCFNLSAAARYVGAGGEYRPLPMYRLRKVVSPSGAVSTVTENYIWEWVNKPNYSDPAGEKVPYPDDYTWVNEDNIVADSYNKYTHNWSDIQIGFQGCTKYASSITCAVVSFLNKAGPRRQYLRFIDGAWAKVTYDDELLDQPDQCDRDYFWDRFLQKKIVHPLATNMKVDKNTRHMVYHHKQTVQLPLELTTQSDLKPVNRLVKIFYRNNDMYNTETLVEEESRSHKLIHHNWAPGANQTYIPPGYCVEPSNAPYESTGPFVHNQSADKWLLIYANDVFHRPAERTTENTATFDLNIRNKYTMYKENLL